MHNREHHPANTEEITDEEYFTAFNLGIKVDISGDEVVTNGMTIACWDHPRQDDDYWVGYVAYGSEDKENIGLYEVDPNADDETRVVYLGELGECCELLLDIHHERQETIGDDGALKLIRDESTIVKLASAENPAIHVRTEQTEGSAKRDSSEEESNETNSLQKTKKGNPTESESRIYEEYDEVPPVEDILSRL